MNTILLNILRQRGYRITPQRELILNAAMQSQAHVTAETIFERVQQHTQALNIATVYRTLDLLVTEGLFRRTDLGGGSMVYAPTEHGPHIHLVCYKCQQTLEAEYQLVANLTSEIQQRHHFSADLHHVSIFGLCANCQSSN